MAPVPGEFGPPPGAGVSEPGRRAGYLAPGTTGTTGPAGAGIGSPATVARQRLVSARFGVTGVQRPGVIPLRPLSVSDIIDASTKTVRRCPGTFLGGSALLAGSGVALGLLAAAVATSGSLLRTTGTIDVLNTTLVSMWFVASALVLAACVAQGLGSFAVAQACLGDRPTLAETWRATRPRLGWCLLAGLALEGVWLAWTIVTVLLVALVANTSAGLAVVIGLLSGLAGLVLIGTLGPRLALVPSIVVLERLRPVAALRRAWALGRGNWAKAAAVTLSTALLAGMIGLVFAVPVVIAGLVTDGTAGSLTAAVGYVLPAVAVLPFLAAANSLLYVDARMRREGLDIVLMRTAAARRRADARPQGRR